LWILLFAVAIFVAIPIFMEAGRWLGKRHIAAAEKAGREAPGSSELAAAVFAILGLLIGFTFLGAGGRFDDRRKLVVEEANIIGTAYLRIDLLPDARQQPLREKFKSYLDSRIATYIKVPDKEAVQAEIIRTLELQKEIWADSTVAAKENPWTPAGILYLPALNQMIDIVTTRTMATEMNQPMLVFLTLISLVFLCALVSGYSNAGEPRRGWFHILVFSAVISISIYISIDFEFPRLGLIRVDAHDHVLVDLRNSWGP
jgi:hypothetical protein